MKIKISIADDHPLVIRGLRGLLHDIPEIDIIDVYHNGKELMEGLEQQQPDVLLLDIQMPGKNGMELAGIITQSYPDVRILALTNLDNNFYIKGMLSQGALGYLLKNSDEEVLIEAIKTVYDGKPYLEPALRDRAWKDMVKTKGDTATQHSLTRREKEILKLIACEYTSQEIAEKLFVSLRTVDTHRLNLLIKLGAKNTVGLVKAAMHMGLIE